MSAAFAVSSLEELRVEGGGYRRTTYFHASSKAASLNGFAGPKTASVVAWSITRCVHAQKSTTVSCLSPGTFSIAECFKGLLIPPIILYITSTARLFSLSSASPGAKARLTAWDHLATALLSLWMSRFSITPASLLMPIGPVPEDAKIGVKLMVRHCFWSVGMSSVALTTYMRVKGKRRV